MARQQIGQESLCLGVEQKRSGCLDELSCVIDWNEMTGFAMSEATPERKIRPCRLSHDPGPGRLSGLA